MPISFVVLLSSTQNIVVAIYAVLSVGAIVPALAKRILSQFQVHNASKHFKIIAPFNKGNAGTHHLLASRRDAVGVERRSYIANNRQIILDDVSDTKKSD